MNSKFQFTPADRIVGMPLAASATLTFILLACAVWGVVALCRSLGGPEVVGRVWILLPAITAFGTCPLVYVCARYRLVRALGRQSRRIGMAEPTAPQDARPATLPGNPEVTDERVSVS
jgi:hypothetical protein